MPQALKDCDGGDTSNISEKTSGDNEMKEVLRVIDKVAHGYDVVSSNMCELVLGALKSMSRW